jgi:predicted PolB exonuclease-like 3'-5' exonuclease
MDPRSLFVFDIETVPDREHHAGEGFPKPLFHRVVAIAFLGAEIEPDSGHELYHLREVRCGGEAGYGEEDLIRAFFSYFERLRPRLVSFNGRSFDLPVLKYRALVHGVSAPWLREGNYGYRYSLDRHCDLMEALPDFGATTRRKLDEVCAVLGLPGKLGIDGSMVEQLHDAGRTEEIRNCCELDVLNTYLVYPGSLPRPTTGLSATWSPIWRRSAVCARTLASSSGPGAKRRASASRASLGIRSKDTSRDGPCSAHASLWAAAPQKAAVRLVRLDGVSSLIFVPIPRQSPIDLVHGTTIAAECARALRDPV